VLNIYHHFMTQNIDSKFFKELEKMDPDEVCRRSLADFDPAKGMYCVTAFGEPCEVYPRTKVVCHAKNREAALSLELGLVVVFYLLGAKEIPTEKRWVSEHSIPGGALFFRGPHRVRNDAIVERFGDDVKGFQEVCSTLGGEPLSMGDAAFRFQVLPRIPLAVVLWYGDEEFEASAKLLMDSTIRHHLPLDVIYAMSVEFIQRLVEHL
jgi:hypothetical protein